ncbi:MAG: type II secretion system protein GspG [Proteobacteria bacterium]|nr:type II secretion system protein GspG [Pseudomonadota bacterium]
MRIGNSGRLSFENTLIFIFILIMIGIFLGYYHKYQEVAKERLAQEQVYNINTAIIVYAFEKKKFPEDLNVLTKEEFLIQGKDTLFKKRFLDFSPVDKEGYPLDPWGRRYRYDRKNHIAYIEKR